MFLLVGRWCDRFEPLQAVCQRNHASEFLKPLFRACMIWSELSNLVLLYFIYFNLFALGGWGQNSVNSPDDTFNKEGYISSAATLRNKLQA